MKPAFPSSNSSHKTSSKFGVLSFLFLVFTFMSILYMGYQLLVQSGHPLAGGEESANFNLASWAKQSAFFVLPFYLISLGCLITAYLKKESSAFKYISSVFHGFFLMTFIYSIVSK